MYGRRAGMAPLGSFGVAKDALVVKQVSDCGGGNATVKPNPPPTATTTTTSISTPTPMPRPTDPTLIDSLEDRDWSEWSNAGLMITDRSINWSFSPVDGS